jgi:hypothetical protein
MNNIIDYIFDKDIDKINEYCKNNTLNFITNRIRETPLGFAVSSCFSDISLSVIKVLLKNNADINMKGGVYNATPLNLLVRGGFKRNPHAESVLWYLIKKGADIHCLDGHGCNLLMRCCQQDSLFLFEYLLQNGVDPTITNELGYGLHYFITKYKRNNFVISLLQNGYKDYVLEQYSESNFECLNHIDDYLDLGPKCAAKLS